MVKVTNIPPPPQDVYTRRVSVEMSEAEWLILKHAANYYASSATVSAPAIKRANFNSDGFYSLDFSKCFVSSETSATVAPTLNDTEKALIRGGRIIPAIKMLRERYHATGGYLGLKDAKDICDAYRDTL